MGSLPQAPIFLAHAQAPARPCAPAFRPSTWTGSRIKHDVFVLFDWTRQRREHESAHALRGPAAELVNVSRLRLSATSAVRWGWRSVRNRTGWGLCI